MIKKIRTLLDYFKFFKNPISCLLFGFGLISKVEVKLKNTDKTINVNDIFVLNKIRTIFHNKKSLSDETINFFNDVYSEKKIIKWLGANILNLHELNLKNINYYYFSEYFIGEYWNEFGIDYSGRTVIDLGSNIGDSSLFFAINGAEVYGFEPVKYLYNYSLEIINLNDNLKDKIHLFNLAVSNEIGELKINDLDSTSEYRDTNSYTVEVTTIGKILKENHIDADVLKMDCEGCEFNIILNTDLSEFNDIIFEHHSKLVNKDYELLIHKLKSQGFKINKLEVETENFDDFGSIHAYK